jgi:hypothetical protein
MASIMETMMVNAAKEMIANLTHDQLKLAMLSLCEANPGLLATVLAPPTTTAALPPQPTDHRLTQPSSALIAIVKRMVRKCQADRLRVLANLICEANPDLISELADDEDGEPEGVSHTVHGPIVPLHPTALAEPQGEEGGMPVAGSGRRMRDDQGTC